MASHNITWVRPTYYVRSLHPTLKLLMWKYDALNTDQERDYVNEKMKIIDRTMQNPKVFRNMIILLMFRRDSLIITPHTETSKYNSVEFLNMNVMGSNRSVQFVKWGVL